MPALNPQLSDRSLKRVYHEMTAQKWVRFSRCAWGKWEWVLYLQATSYFQYEWMGSANLPEEDLPSRTSGRPRSTSKHLLCSTSLIFDYSNEMPIESRRISRRNSNAACLFLVITKNPCAEDSQGPCRLYCDGLHPWNPLINLDTYLPSSGSYWLGICMGSSLVVLVTKPGGLEGDLSLLLARYTPSSRAFSFFLSFLFFFFLGRLEQPWKQADRTTTTTPLWVTAPVSTGERLHEDWFISGLLSSKIQFHRRNILDIHWPSILWSLFFSCWPYTSFLTKTNQYTKDEENFDDHYPIDILLDLWLSVHLGLCCALVQ